MTVRRTGFEAFADGVAIDTSGAAAGETLLTTAVNNPTGVGALRHANAANKLFGTVAAKVGTVGTAATVRIGWVFTGGNTTSFSIYIKVSASPPSTLRFFRLTRSSGSSFELSLTTGRAVRILDISAATKATFNAIAANTYYRIDGIVNHHASTGSATVSISNWDETAAIQTLNVTNAAFSGPCTGGDAGIQNSLANVPDFFIDEFAIDDAGAAISPVAGSLNDPPTLSLGGSSDVAFGSNATITATASDPQGGSLTYAWDITTKPTGSTASLAGETDDSATFTPDKAGTYIVQCTVTKVTGGKTKVATRQITVSSGVSVVVGGVPVPANVGVKVGGSILPATVSVKS